MLKFADIGRVASKHSLKISTTSSKKIKNASVQGNRVDEKGSLKFVQRILNKCKGSNPVALKVLMKCTYVVRVTVLIVVYYCQVFLNACS